MAPTTSHRLPSVFLTPFILAIVGIFFFLALLNGQWELTVTAILLFSVAGGAGIWSRRSLKGVECTAGIDKPRLFPGQKIVLHATAANGKILPVWIRISAPIRGALGCDTGNVPEIASESGLLWHQQAAFHWELTALGRGIHQVGPLRLASGDLFGFFIREREISGPIEAIVFPRILPVEPWSPQPRDFFGDHGGAAPVHDPVYILGTRDYQYGGPAKHIHWKASARHHKLQEKIFEPSAQEKLLIAIDAAPFAGSGAEAIFEGVLERAASTAVRLSERGCAVGLITNSLITGDFLPFIRIARGADQPSILLERLARMRMETTVGMIDAFNRHVTATSGTSCLFFSLVEDETVQAAKEYCLRRGMPFRFVPGLPVDDAPRKDSRVQNEKEGA